MPLMHCVDCEGTVSTEAKACPHCGRPSRVRRPPGRAVVWFSRLVLAAFAGLMTWGAAWDARDGGQFLVLALATMFVLVWSFYLKRVALFGASAICALIGYFMVAPLLFG